MIDFKDLDFDLFLCDKDYFMSLLYYLESNKTEEKRSAWINLELFRANFIRTL